MGRENNKVDQSTQPTELTSISPVIELQTIFELARIGAVSVWPWSLELSRILPEHRVHGGPSGGDADGGDGLVKPERVRVLHGGGYVRVPERRALARIRRCRPLSGRVTSGRAQHMLARHW